MTSFISKRSRSSNIIDFGFRYDDAFLSTRLIQPISIQFHARPYSFIRYSLLHSHRKYYKFSRRTKTVVISFIHCMILKCNTIFFCYDLWKSLISCNENWKEVSWTFEFVCDTCFYKYEEIKWGREEENSRINEYYWSEKVSASRDIDWAKNANRNLSKLEKNIENGNEDGRLLCSGSSTGCDNIKCYWCYPWSSNQWENKCTATDGCDSSGG